MELNFETTPFSTKVTTADDYYFESDDPDNLYVNDVKKPKLVKKIKNVEKSDKKKKIKVKVEKAVIKKKGKKKDKNDKEETKGEDKPPKKPKMKLEALHHTLPANLKE